MYSNKELRHHFLQFLRAGDNPPALFNLIYILSEKEEED